MAHHGRTGPNAIPAANRKTAPEVAKESLASKAKRGRTARTTNPDANVPNAREGKVTQERITESNRPIGAGGGKLRGDRQNMAPDPGIRGDRARNGKRQAGANKGLRNDRNPQSVAGRKHNRVANEGG